MKNCLIKITSVLLTAAVVFSLAACNRGAGAAETSAPAANASALPSETQARSDTTAQSTTSAVAAPSTEGQTADHSGEKVTGCGQSIPSSKAEILAAYTAVMNKAKAAKPGFTKYYYQDFPVSERKVGGAAGRLLPLANLFMTSEKKATENPSVFAKGNNMMQFPILNASKGCMLTNLSAIKSAKCDKLTNGNYKIIIVLNDELNPEPYKAGEVKAPSNTGNMFITIAKSDVDYQMANNKAVRLVIKSGEYTLKYYDCTATLEYNPRTNQVVSLEQVTNGFVTVSGEIYWFGHSAGTAVLVDTLKIFDLQY